MNRAPFRRWGIATATVSVLAYSMADGAPLVALVGVLAGLVAITTARRPAERSTPRTVLNLLVLTATLLVTVQLLSGREKAISTLSLYLALILVIKMFDLVRVRDDAQLLALSIFVAVGATLTGQSLFTGALVAMVAPLAIVTAILLQLHLGAEFIEQRQASVDALCGRTRAPAFPRRPFGGGQLGLTMSLAVILSALISLFVFVAMPRNLVQGMGGWGTGRGEAISGFVDEIRLGQSGTITQSQEVVMEVEVTSASGGAAPITTGETLYLRGAVLDEYDELKGTWNSRTSKGNDATSITRRARADQAIELGPSGGSPALLKQKITLRAASRGGGPLFAVYRPLAVSADRETTFAVSSRDMTLQRSGDDGGRMTYTVVSVRDGLDDRTDGDAPAADPGRFASGAVHALAVALLADAGVPADAPSRTPADNRRAARAIIEHLRRTCSYSLDMVSPGPGQDPIDMFLFSTHQGHCEYFASAMVMLLRSVQIPARVVTGFAAGEYNSVAQRYTVRQSDAHAWVEMRTRADRWETFDPTPPADLMHARRSTGGILGWLKQIYEALEFSWIDNVVTYDQHKREGILDSVLGMSDSGEGWLRRLIKTAYEAIAEWLPQQGVAAIASRLAVVFGAVGVLWLLWRAFRHAAAWMVAWLGQTRRDAHTGPLITPQTRFYRRMLDLLQCAGEPFHKPASSPPLAHARAVTATDPTRDRLGAIISDLGSRYYAARFGERTIDATEQATIASLLDELESVLATQRAAPTVR